MRRLFFALGGLTCFLAGPGFSTELDLTGGTAVLAPPASILLNDIQVGQVTYPVTARLKWDARSNSFRIVELTTQNKNQGDPSPAAFWGTWNFVYDPNCDGENPDPTRPTEIRKDFTCVDVHGPKTCKWGLEKDLFTLTWPTNPGWTVSGKLTDNDTLAGKVANTTSDKNSCFTATRDSTGMDAKTVRKELDALMERLK